MLPPFGPSSGSFAELFCRLPGLEKNVDSNRIAPCPQQLAVNRTRTARSDRLTVEFDRRLETKRRAGQENYLRTV